MGTDSGIQWTDHTFNPWVGCTKVSPGCKHCYAEAFDKKVGGGKDPATGEMTLRWGNTAPRIRTKNSTWALPLAWNADAGAKKVRQRVFCASLSDVFEDRPEVRPWRLNLFKLISITPNLDWLLLTKRPGNVMRLLTEVVMDSQDASLTAWVSDWLLGDPPPNVWMGTTVEDNAHAKERIPALLEIPAALRFLSMEPLLEQVSIQRYVEDGGIDWVIIGGESGESARFFSTNWAKSLLHECRAYGITPFVKQMGSNCVDAGGSPWGLNDSAGGDMSEWPSSLAVREFPSLPLRIPEDKPLDEDAAIRAAHPTATGDHATYTEAHRLVSARQTKRGLTELVNWLLVRAKHSK